MRINKTEIEGREGTSARISRKPQSDWIDVTILTPEIPDGRQHAVTADCRDDVWSMAEVLQLELDGYRGAGGDKREYYAILEQFMD